MSYSIAPYHFRDPFEDSYYRFNRSLFDPEFNSSDSQSSSGENRSLANRSSFDRNMALDLPRSDIEETGSAFYVRLDLPGYNMNDLSIELNHDRLTISGQRRRERVEGEESSTYHRMERSSSRFQRCFRLPKEVVNEEKIDAKLQNGVLTMTLPKRETTPTTTTRKIAITQ